MNKENFGIDSDSMLEAASGAGRVSSKLMDTSSSMPSDFSRASRLNGDTVKEITKQISLLGSSTGSW